MSLIRMYYSGIDIKPSAMLRNFLRWIGFYVEEISGDTKESGAVSVADVYIISDAFSEYENDNAETIDIIDKSNVIAVCLDKWNISKSEIKVIHYDGTHDRKFMRRFLKVLGGILKNGKHEEEDTLIGSAMRDWDELVGKVSDSYLRHKILPMTRYAGFYRQNDLFLMALSRLRRFIADIRLLSKEYGNPDILKYVMLYAQNELDLMCKRNHYLYYRDPVLMIKECDELLFEHTENAQLYLLKADIRSELQEKYLVAWDNYEKCPADDLSYVNYKLGMISKLFEDYESVIYSMEQAALRKSDYYKAYYELGKCYEEIADYYNAVEQYTMVYQVLQHKLDRHLLDPIEIEYLYLAMAKVAFIKKEKEGRSLSAREYMAMAERAKKEIDNKTYLKLVWPEAAANANLLESIREAMIYRIGI